MCAVIMVCMFLIRLIPAMELVLIYASVFCVHAYTMQTNAANGAACYIAAALLSVMLHMAYPLIPILFVAYGAYPLIRVFVMRIKSVVVQYIIKIIILDGAALGIYLLFRQLLSFDADALLIPTLLVAQFALVLCDYSLDLFYARLQRIIPR